MKRNKKFFYFGGVIILLFILIINSNFIKKTNVYKFIKENLSYTFYYLNKPVNNIIINFKINKKDLLNENKKLKEELNLLNLTSYKNIELEKELQELKKVLELKNTYIDYEFTNASVLTRSVEYWYQTITIDKGEKENIKEKDLVIFNSYLIGTVSSVANNSSTINLISAGFNNAGILVLVESNDEFYQGVIYSYKDDYILVKGISNFDNITINSKVVTTGIGNYKAGIFVGYVAKIESDEYNLGKILYVKQDIDLNNIKYVSIVRSNND